MTQPLAMQPRAVARPAKSKSRLGVWVVVVLSALGLGAWKAFGPAGALRGTEPVALQGAEVLRGPLRISIVERGNLSSANASELRNETEQSTTILAIIEEGTWVEKGDLLCELDVAELTDELFLGQISVRNAEAAYVTSQQNYEIQQSQNESDIARAGQDLAFAKQDLEKFLQADRRLSIAQADEEVTIAKEEFERAQSDFEWSQKLAAKGFLTQSELEADKLALTRAQIGLDQKTRSRESQLQFELPKQEAELRAALEEAERELVRVKLQATARIADYEADRSTNEAKLKLERDKAAKVERQIAAGKLFADRAGMVVYAKEDGGRWGRDEPIEKGTEVSPRQAIITIPRAGGMVAEASLHESVLKQVRPGMPAMITVDALPQHPFHGSVKSVAMLPDQNSWYANPDQRLYKTQVAVNDASEELRPGMSCAVEILVEEIPDALHIPVQAVFKDGGDNVVFVARAGNALEKRTVVVGSYNDRWVEIESGVELGETVALSPPADFAPKAAPRPQIPEGEGFPPPGIPGAASTQGEHEAPGASSSLDGSWPRAAEGDMPAAVPSEVPNAIPGTERLRGDGGRGPGGGGPGGRRSRSGSDDQQTGAALDAPAAGGSEGAAAGDPIEAAEIPTLDDAVSDPTRAAEHEDEGT